MKNKTINITRQLLEIPELIVDKVDKVDGESLLFTFHNRKGWVKNFKKKSYLGCTIALKVSDELYDIYWFSQLNLQFSVFDYPYDIALSYQDSSLWLKQQIDCSNKFTAFNYQENLSFQLTLANWIEQKFKEQNKKPV